MKKQNSKIENSVTIVIGSMKTGVTTENKEHIKRYIKEKKKQKTDYRVLVIDFNNEYDGKKVSLSDLKDFKNKVAIIGSPEMSIKERVNLVKQVCYNYRGGLIVIDDFHRLGLKGKNLNELIAYLCVVSRNSSLDVILDFGGSFRNIPIRALINATYMRLHYTIENIDMYAKKLNNFELYEFATEIQGVDKYKFVLIDMENSKVFGCSKSEYLQAYKDLTCDKIQRVKNIEQIANIPDYLLGVAFSNMKHIPISNVNRNYK